MRGFRDQHNIINNYITILKYELYNMKNNISGEQGLLCPLLDPSLVYAM